MLVKKTPLCLVNQSQNDTFFICREHSTIAATAGSRSEARGTTVSQRRRSETWKPSAAPVPEFCPPLYVARDFFTLRDFFGGASIFSECTRRFFLVKNWPIEINGTRMMRVYCLSAFRCLVFVRNFNKLLDRSIIGHIIWS